MAYSRDVLPLVGPVPGKKGLWAAVAFHGHGASPLLLPAASSFTYLTVFLVPSPGMSRILCVTRSLAQHIQSGTWDSRLPRSFEITAERFERAKTAPKLTDDQPAAAAAKSAGGAAEVGGTAIAPVKAKL